jgi:hypothetical protein
MNMEFLFQALPYFNIGLVVAVLSRFTGASMTILVLPAILYLGAYPAEATIFLLTYGLYNFITVTSQQQGISLKSFPLFPGVKALIPMVIVVAAIALTTFGGIILFVAWFVAELSTLMYRSIDKDVRPKISSLVIMCTIASAIAVVGVVALAGFVKVFPVEWYYVAAGLVIFGVTFFMWQVGKDRSLYGRCWDKFLYGAVFLNGFMGLDISDWCEGLPRERVTPLARVFPIVANWAMLVALTVSYLLFHYFAIMGLFAAIGSAIGIRFFGLYSFGRREGLPLLAIAIIIMAVFCLYLTQPIPIGLVGAEMLQGL